MVYSLEKETIKGVIVALFGQHVDDAIVIGYVVIHPKFYAGIVVMVQRIEHRGEAGEIWITHDQELPRRRGD